MDWTTIISAAIAAISAGGGIGIFFDRKHKKRAAELANESTVCLLYTSDAADD